MPAQVIDPLGLAQLSPYLTEHITHFGEYSTRELGIAPDDYDYDYDADLDIDFSTRGKDEAVAA